MLVVFKSNMTFKKKISMASFSQILVLLSVESYIFFLTCVGALMVRKKK